ncbi:hypothetical protein D3C71_1693480 [compost metagenome]
MHLGPGMGCRLLRHVFHHQITGNIAGGQAHQPGGGNEDMGMVLADALAGFECQFGGGFGVGRTRHIFHLAVDLLHQVVQAL